MKNIYEAPVMETEEFEANDVVIASISEGTLPGDQLPADNFGDV